MDGNRRYAQGMGQPVIVGHQCGAQTANNIIEWWLRFMPNTVAYTHPGPGPRYLTIWAFSAENFKRPKEEVDGLFHLMAWWPFTLRALLSLGWYTYSKYAFASWGTEKDFHESCWTHLNLWKRWRVNIHDCFFRLRWAMVVAMKSCIQCGVSWLEGRRSLRTASARGRFALRSVFLLLSSSSERPSAGELGLMSSSLF